MRDKIIETIDKTVDKLIYDTAVVSCDFSETLAEEIEKLYENHIKTGVVER